jgi:hypothetical protein
MTPIYHLRAIPQVIGLFVVLLSNGLCPCWAATPLNIAAHQARLQLTDQPRDAQQVVAVLKQLAADKSQPEALKTCDVVITGQIGGVPNVWPTEHPQFPWYRSQASFFLVDSKVAAQCTVRALPSNGKVCIVCQRQAAKNARAMAVVNLVDENGETLPVNARELMNLKENQTVIVRGKAKLLAGSMLVIDADGIYVPATQTAARGVNSAAK